MASGAWRRAKGWPSWVLLAAVVVGVLVAGAIRDGGPRTSEERVEEITKRLACPTCDGESVFESRAPASVALRNEVQARVTEGVLTDDEIVSSIEDVYGATVLLVPKATGLDALVWGLPAGAFVCAVAGLAFAFRRWRAAAGAVPSEADRELVAQALRREGDGEDGGR